jgi:hypothetical protein
MVSSSIPKFGNTSALQQVEFSDFRNGSNCKVRPKADGQVGQDAFAVIREAMRSKDMVALARVVLAKRERVIMLQRGGGGDRDRHRAPPIAPAIASLYDETNRKSDNLPSPTRP